jgi:hypothetical protein
MERSNLKQLNKAEGKEKYHVEVSNRFTALVDFVAKVEFNRAWKMIREDIKLQQKTV